MYINHMKADNVEYLTIPEAASEAGITDRTLRNWIKADVIKYKKGARHGRRRLLILKADLKAIT